MTIVHIAFRYGLKNTGGAAIASTRLHKALIDAGIDSHYVCVHKVDDGQNVHQLPSGLRRVAFLFLTKCMRCVWKFTPYHKSVCLNVVPLLGLKQLLGELDPDVVHVQWINADVASLEQLGHLREFVRSTCKVVFNLHDLYVMLTGGGYPRDRQYIEGLDPKSTSWLERWLFARKQRMVIRSNPIFIGPSRWVCEACCKSLIGRNHDAYVISNIIDSIYKFYPEKYSLHEKSIVLFGCYGGRFNDLKGWKEFAAALKRLPIEWTSSMEVYVFGENGQNEVVNNVPVKIVGNISNPKMLLELYHKADLFVFPSIQETQGMTKCEALCCGLPVIAFDRTACAEYIDHKVTGWVSPDGNIADYTDGIVYWLKRIRLNGKMIRRQISSSAWKKFDAARILHQYLEVISK